MTATRTKEQEQEIVRSREDTLDVRLFEVMEIVKMPEKWSVDSRHNIITVYPHPVITREGRVKGVEYMSTKFSLSTQLPHVLAERYSKLQKDIAETYKTRYGKHSMYIDDWLELVSQGYKLKQIAELYNIKSTAVSNSLSYHVREQYEKAKAEARANKRRSLYMKVRV